MTTKERQQLIVRLCAEALEAVFDPMPPEISVDAWLGRRRGGPCVHFVGRPMPPNLESPMALAANGQRSPGTRPMSRAEVALLGAATDDFQSKDALAASARVADLGLAAGDVGAILRNLAEVGLLESESGKGFRRPRRPS